MATKEEALQYVKALGAQRVITKDEMVAAFDEGSGTKTDALVIKKLGIAEILYYIGGAIVFLGISILLWQNWSTLSPSTRMFATLGAGIAAYFVGLLLGRDKKTETVSSAFYLISALVIPIGLYVVFDNAGFDMGSYGLQSLVSGIAFGTYLLSYLVFRKNIFTLFSIIFGTWFYYALMAYLFGKSPDWVKHLEYLTLAAGLGYVFLGHAFSKNERAPLSGFLYSFGILGFLGAAFALGGWEPEQNIFWELIFPGLAFGTLFISVHIKSKAFLTWGTLFLMAYILKITSEYFSGGLGWPLALVIAGLAMIGAGYMSFSLKKKYLSA